ncbi:hypothetical protein DYB36_009014 [Aphanomyces astaci]|uniref:Uncharacterized protein n=2 Tax=Aphanomyces astaci TaxID=112090 RepID=A0A397A439_APHAT|nr:hypothetical protein DYB36_009014 [Aphanomyces astaci]
MLHSRGTFADLNQKEVLVPIIDIFHDMDLQQKAMTNIDVAMTHRAENSTMRQQDIAAPSPSGGPADRHSNTNCGSNGVDNGPPLTTPSLVDSSAVSQPHSRHSSADHDSTPLHRRSPSSANYRFPSAQPPPRSITTPPPTADMRSLYIPPVHYTSSLRATSAEQPTTGPSDLPPAFEPSPPLQPAASSDYLRIIERFRSRRLEDLDDRNNVLRLDLTPAIDLRTPLAAAETAAIIGCLENVEFVVVVQGLAARLNASYWTVSFLLTSLPPLLPVQCDHYRADRHGVMTFVGSVLVPLRAVHAHFLHGSPVQLPYPDGPVVVDGGPDDGLALHDMELAFHSTLVVLGEMELVVFDPLTAKQRSRVLDFLRRMGYLPGTRADLVDKYLHNLKYDGLPTLNELSNTFKQCLGCTVYDVAPPFVVCVDCSRAPSRFDPRAGIRSSAGHTGSLPRSQAYKERSDVVAVCECPGRTPCAVCEGCDQCSCLCHTMFLTRYRLLRLGNNQNI